MRTIFGMRCTKDLDETRSDIDLLSGNLGFQIQIATARVKSHLKTLSLARARSLELHGDGLPDSRLSGLVRIVRNHKTRFDYKSNGADGKHHYRRRQFPRIVFPHCH